jgi:hypothetical protein
MKNAYNRYIDLGYRYEMATGSDAVAIAKIIKRLLGQENPDSQRSARYFIERGRKEARQS